MGRLWCTRARVLPYYHSPNIQTSLAEVKRLKLMDSGAIHLIGNRLTDAAKERAEEEARMRSSGFLPSDWEATCGGLTPL